jgi:hypothetical protein
MQRPSLSHLHNDATSQAIPVWSFRATMTVLQDHLDMIMRAPRQAWSHWLTNPNFSKLFRPLPRTKIDFIAIDLRVNWDGEIL